MSFLEGLGAFAFVLGVIQMTPFIRRRAAQRGLTGGYVVPFSLSLIGFLVFIAGYLLAGK